MNTREYPPCILRCRDRELNCPPISGLRDGVLDIAIEVTIAKEKRPKDVVQIYNFNVSSLRPLPSERHNYMVRK